MSSIEEKTPVIHIFAGPNGSGKSTLIDKFINKEAFPQLYFNADEIAGKKKIGPIQALKEVSIEKKKAFLNKESFAIETVTSAISLAKEAKQNGYYINLHCILTQEKEVNIARVQNRVKLGGHDVPKVLIKSRYDRFMNSLSEVIKMADNIKIYDNSLERPILIAEKNMGKDLKIYPQKNSKWTKEKLEEILKPHQNRGKVKQENPGRGGIY